ncbi:hypothetical protein FE04_00875 [Salmonella enterica subsp. enterica serovar Infantis]|nr:hypothetical protein [Salmonella enterica subsp. enterica serovar Infantis]
MGIFTGFSPIVIQREERAGENITATKTDEVPGRDGKSAYEIWRDEQQKVGLPDSLDAYLKFQEGKAGKSAYEIWQGQQPADADTSTAAYLEFQKGKPGEGGAPKAPDDVGAYVFAFYRGVAFELTIGDTIPGNNLYIAGIAMDGALAGAKAVIAKPMPVPVLPGTWRCAGFCGAIPRGFYGNATLWVRIL